MNHFKKKFFLEFDTIKPLDITHNGYCEFEELENENWRKKDTQGMSLSDKDIDLLKAIILEIGNN